MPGHGYAARASARWGYALRGAGQTPAPSPAPSAPLSALDASGWRGVMAVPADLAFAPLTVNRAGFDSNGGATTIADTLLTTKRVRQPYPNHASLTAADVALSDVVLATDSIPGLSNSSTALSPKPIVNWAMLGRQLVGNTLTLEVTGNHWFARNGRPFACVEFSATDGVTTVTAKTSAMVVSGHAGDRNAVLVYRAVVDISTLATGLITANAKVYPWVGGAASVADSALASDARGFSPRHFYKDAARFAAPPLVYVASTGNDASGVVSTDAATASATPCQTVQGAIDRLIAATGVTGGTVDGCRIRIKDTVGLGSAAVARAQRCAAVIIERDPNVAKASAILAMSGSWRARLGVGTLLGGLTEGAVLLRDVTFNRTVTGTTFFGEAATKLSVMMADDVAFNNGGFNNAILSNAHLSMDGVTLTGTSASLLNAASGNEIRMVRGLLLAAGNNAIIEGYLMLGCRITAPGAITPTTRPASGTIIQFNSLLSPISTTHMSNPGGEVTITGFSFSQNLVEVTHTTTSTPSVSASADSAVVNLTHCLIDNNTITGHFQAGRCNLFYDETVASGRNHIFCRVRNSILAGYYHKGDVFVTDGNRVGNWQALYGVGNHRNWTLWISPGNNQLGDSQGQAYQGLGAVWAASNITRNDPGFVSYQASGTNGVTNAAVAGAGGGDYTLQSGAAAIGKVPSAEEIFPLDLSGNPRDRGSTGAYR